MKAVFYTGGKKPWATVLGECPWALLPVGSRPLLSYWLELCIDLGITEVQMILGRDAEHIEQFCGDGEKWGLTINYSFIRPGDSPREYLKRNLKRWTGGLLYISDAVFLSRQESFDVTRLKEASAECCVVNEGQLIAFMGRSEEPIQRFVQNGICDQPDCKQADYFGLDPVLIRDISHYYELNMTVVKQEMHRYVSSGYSSVDGASIGYNVITPPSVTLTPPFAIGNDCRIGALCSIGAGSVISDHVLIDRQCEVSDSIILSDTYVGCNLEIKGKIVSGNRIIDPSDGSFLDIEDPWLVSGTRPRKAMSDFVRLVVGWSIALAMAIVQLPPFLILYGIIRAKGRGSFVKKSIWGVAGKQVSTYYFVAAESAPSLLRTMFYGASLDRFPQLLNVLSGKLWLCGQVPKESAAGGYKEGSQYFPAVFSFSDAFAEIDKQMDALYYAHTRSLTADLRILYHALFTRLFES